ncbi:MAG: aminotransferase class I/II-fold pyridoxal phosphate-dependent enzyme [Pseudomonadota bacterium]
MLKNALSFFIPHKRFNIFSGTNTWKEWRMFFCSYFTFGSYQDESVIDDYEKAFAKASDTIHAISFGAGRMGLYAILEALGLQMGDEIILPAFTCVVVPNAIIYRGLKPIYVDIDPVTFNIDVSKIEKAITSRTRALYIQHTFGIICDIEKAREIADRYKLYLVEDACHALGATYKGKKAGSLADVAYFSTDHSKVISTVLGGMVTTNNDEWATKIRAIQQSSPFLTRKMVHRVILAFLTEYMLLSPYGVWLGRKFFAALVKFKMIFFYHDELKTERPTDYPYPCRLSSIQAKLGLSQLADLDRNLDYRRKIALWLESRIKWYDDLPQEFLLQQTWIRYSFLVADRKKFEALFCHHFDLGIWFTSILHGRVDDLDQLGYIQGSCPVAEFVAQHIVNFPTHLRIPLKFLQDNWLEYEKVVLTMLDRTVV